MLKQHGKRAERKVIKQLTEISPELADINLETVTVEDAAGVRNAQVYYDANTAARVPDGDWRKIETAITASEFIEGVTTPLPWEPPPGEPVFFNIPRRSLLILPGDVETLDQASYAHYAKGLRFDPEDTTLFDVMEMHRKYLGADIPKNITPHYPLWDDQGRMTLNPYPPFYLGRQAFFQSVREFGMMWIARNRRDLTDSVDQPEFFGVWSKLQGPDGSHQGFVISNLPDFDQRGDVDATSTNQTYIGRMLAETPKIREGMIRQVMADVEETGGNPEMVRRFLDTDDPKQLSHFAFIAGHLGATGITNIKYGDLIAAASIDHLFNWRRDLEAFAGGTTGLARLFVDRGIVQMQPNLGNVRFRRIREGVRSPTQCDFENTHDLWSMTYAQAVGYIAGSVKNLTAAMHSIDNQGILNRVGPDCLGAALNGFFPEFADSRGLDEVARLVRHRREGRTGIEYLLSLNADKPILEIEHPLISLIQDIYPLDKHEHDHERIMRQ